jgi:hypothetical protein
MGADAGDPGILDELDRVGGACVFGERAVVEVHVAAALRENHILQHRAEANRLVDLSTCVQPESSLSGTLRKKNVRCWDWVEGQGQVSVGMCAMATSANGGANTDRLSYVWGSGDLCDFAPQARRRRPGRCTWRSSRPRC